MSMGETAGVVGFAAFGDDPATNEPLHPQAAVRAALEGYLDEEDLLGFHVWVWFSSPDGMTKQKILLVHDDASVYADCGA